VTDRSTVILKGDSLVTYSFDVFPLEDSFHPVAAVFAVTREPEGAGPHRHEVVFVGEAARMPGQLRDHPKAACFERHGANRVCVHRIEDETARRDAVTDLVDTFRPPCND
jgi:hypothetical protein